MLATPAEALTFTLHGRVKTRADSYNHGLAVASALRVHIRSDFHGRKRTHQPRLRMAEGRYARDLARMVGVAGAVAIVFALSWPALIRSVDARRWSAALISLVALALSGAYSISAALGSASGVRTNAATIETATTDARTKAQAAYDAAKAELDGLKPARPAAELEPLIRSARPVCRIVVTLSRRDTVCEPPPTLVAELGRSKRRAELEGKIEEGHMIKSQIPGNEALKFQ